MTTGEFINLLWNKFFEPRTDLLHYGRIRFWLEDSDESQPETLLDKRAAARICHQFMKIELGIKDSENIDKAKELKDLYNCRVCANHIAQVYIKKIMGADDFETVDSNGNSITVKLFNMLELISSKEAIKIVNNCHRYNNNISNDA